MGVVGEKGDDIYLGLVKAKCGCFVRSEVLLLPTSMPWPPTEDSVDAIEQWVKDYHARSAFNVCEHQALQSMTGPPAEPVAVHQPIPLPHHRRAEVLAVLERDCKLGVRYQHGLQRHSALGW